MADNKPIFDLLLAQPRIDINLKTIEEHTALYFALLKYESGDTSEDAYVHRLLEKGAQTSPIYSETGDSLLQVLVVNGAKNAAVFLTDRIDSYDHVNVKGESALHTACFKNCPSVVERLLQKGANPNLLTNELHHGPLHYAVRSNAADCVEKFIEHNEGLGENKRLMVNFNGRDTNGDTPLSLALNEGCKELVPVLIRGKADVNVRNGNDFTLLHQAILREDPKTAIFLLDNGADINAK